MTVGGVNPVISKLQEVHPDSNQREEYTKPQLKHMIQTIAIQYPYIMHVYWRKIQHTCRWPFWKKASDIGSVFKHI